MYRFLQAVAEMMAASPVQPRRSSRWGQSVGMSRKLSNCPHMALRNSWLTRLSAVSMEPVGSMSERMCTPAKSSGRTWETPSTFT